MGLVDGIKKFQETRASKREHEHRKSIWEVAVNAAIKDGAKYAMVRDKKDPTQLLVTLDEVPEKHWIPLQRVWFQRLHAESTLFLCQGPPPTSASAPRAPGRPFITNKKTGQRREVR